MDYKKNKRTSKYKLTNSFIKSNLIQIVALALSIIALLRTLIIK